MGRGWGPRKAADSLGCTSRPSPLPGLARRGDTQSKVVPLITYKGFSTRQGLWRQTSYRVQRGSEQAGLGLSTGCVTLLSPLHGAADPGHQAPVAPPRTPRRPQTHSVPLCSP